MLRKSKWQRSGEFQFGEVASSVGEFIGLFIGQLIDYFINKIADEDLRDAMKALKDYLDDNYGGIDVEKFIDTLKKKDKNIFS